VNRLPNKPLERAGVNPRANTDALSAGRSAPSRWRDCVFDRDPRRAMANQKVMDFVVSNGARLYDADTILSIEAPGFAGWKPSPRDLADLRVPAILMTARDTLPLYREVTDSLARQFNVEPITLPGRDAFYYYRPQDLADALRPILHGLVAG